MRSGTLCCDRTSEASKLASVGIAHNHLKERRKAKIVPVGPGGTLADYVPFYFAPRSPMLYSIHQGNVENYNEGQAPIVHLVASAEAVAGFGAKFVFTDGHAVVDISEYFDDLNDLDNVDWDVMPLTYWNDTLEDGDRKRRRQAEFLVFGTFPWEWITEIGVINNSVAKDVEGLLPKDKPRPPVGIHRNWYY